MRVDLRSVVKSRASWRAALVLTIVLAATSAFRVDEGAGGRGVRGSKATVEPCVTRTCTSRILKIEDPWRVAAVEVNLEQGEVVVHVEHDGEALSCPQCGQPARRYDTRRRRWRHLDTCEYRTILAAEMPRVHCQRHKVKQVTAPWSECRSRITSAVRGGGDRLAEGGVDLGGGAAHGAELGRGGRHHAARRAARVGAPRGASSRSQQRR